VRDALLDALFASGSDLLVLPVQDVFGWTDRINVPALIDDSNWTWRLPWPVDRLDAQPEAAERQQALRRWSERHARVQIGTHLD
jgi:4-alpha-glucanotransferase